MRNEHPCPAHQQSLAPALLTLSRLPACTPVCVLLRPVMKITALGIPCEVGAAGATITWTSTR